MKKPPNPSWASNSMLVQFIVQPFISSTERTGLTTTAESVDKVLGPILLRQKAINVLRGRMRNHFSSDVIGEIAAKDPGFAKVFCEQHLNLRLTSRQQMLELKQS